MGVVVGAVVEVVVGVAVQVAVPSGTVTTSPKSLTSSSERKSDP